jgi:UDP-N-acetylmuramoylalanine--D-glutamate ligase
MAKQLNITRPVILLSPACASFDQFDSFEARGDAFRTMVQKLAVEAAA